MRHPKASARDAKRAKYTVAPRVGDFAGDGFVPGGQFAKAAAAAAAEGEDGESAAAKRGASYEVMKNRGLTPHKSKLGRNPRAKKREKFRKAEVRRGGQVRSVKEGVGDSYDGEGTGIRAGISRSRKMK